MSKVIIRQLFDQTSSTYTYILYDKNLLEAVVIDPVLENFERDCILIEELSLKVVYSLETHIHADHITASYKFREKYGCRIAVGESADVECSDLNIADADQFKFGGFCIEAIATPGHTDTCISFHCEDMLFTGDTLLIRGCGRTDFQQGSSLKLFRSVREKLFKFPEDTLVYPAHDYNGFTSSTIGEEKLHNKRLGLAKSKEDFISIMENLNLDHPKKIKQAVPANLNCGEVKE